MTDVDEGSEVQFQVRAENEAGVGHPSEPTDIMTIEDPISMYLTHVIHSTTCLVLTDINTVFVVLSFRHSFSSD